MATVFLPQPHRVTLHRPRMALPHRPTIGITEPALAPAAEQARAVLPRASVAAAVDAGETLTLRRDARLPAGGYQIECTKQGITIDAASCEAATNAVRTLRQAAAQSPDGALPTLSIEDRPDFTERGIYHDVTRGRVPQRDALLEMASTLADYKLNQLQLYVEHAFRFRQHPRIGQGASPLNSDDVRALDEHCRSRDMTLVPSLASFGHMATVLKHKAYHHLAEDYGQRHYVHPDAKKRHRGWTVSPANPKTYEFLDELYAEFLPIHSAGAFNVCCDEVYDLGWGQSYDLCRKRGRGRVFLDHVKKLRELSQQYGKDIMFWGDVLQQYPELYKDVPDDAALLMWGYAHDWPFERIGDLRQAGIRCYACPGTSSWRSLFPRLPESCANIHGFAEAARRHGAEGVLTTDWGGGGHYNFPELSWYGFLFAAEQSWNVDADRNSFTRRFCKLFLNVDRADVARAIDELGRISHLRFGVFYQSIWQYVFFAAPNDKVLHQPRDRASVCRRDGRIEFTHMHLDAKLGRSTMERLDRVREPIADAASDRHADPHGVLPYWLFAIDTIRHAAHKLAVIGPGGDGNRRDKRKVRQEMQSLRKRFERLWMQRNRRSEIRRVLGYYDRAIKALR